jgi:hypothetical protein
MAGAAAASRIYRERPKRDVFFFSIRRFVQPLAGPAFRIEKIDAAKEKNSEHFDLRIRLKIRTRHAITPKSTDACMDML